MISIYSEGRYQLNNLQEIEEGNPGIGGTEYLLIQLFYYLCKYHPEMKVQYLCTDTSLRGEHIIAVRDALDAIRVADENEGGIFIFVPKDRERSFYDCLEKTKLKAIAWVHNFTTYYVLDDLKKCSTIKRVVFVGKQHYDFYLDSNLMVKSDYIFNMIPEKKYSYEMPQKKENVVTYVGVIIPTKGFHRLAAVWKQIVKQVPDAQLYVVGSGQVYNGEDDMGTWGIASKRYEAELAKYLTNEKGEILPSVHIMGKLGKEKDEILRRTKVGVANPTGKSETFCLSAVEFKSHGIPVISYRGKGLLDTVRDGVDGVLIRRKKELRDEIVRLLKNMEWNEQLGRNGIESGCDSFRPQIIIEEWVRVICEVQEDRVVRKRSVDSFLWYDTKWMKCVNRMIKRLFHGKWHSIAYIVSWFKERIKGILSLVR